MVLGYTNIGRKSKIISQIIEIQLVTKLSAHTNLRLTSFELVGKISVKYVYNVDSLHCRLYSITNTHIQPFGLHGLIQHRVLKAALQVKKVRLEIVIAMIKLLIFQIAMALTPEKRNAIPKDVVSLNYISYKLHIELSL